MTTPPDAATIRFWASNQGLPVGRRGRISASIKAAFFQVHTPSGKPKKARTA